MKSLSGFKKIKKFHKEFLIESLENDQTKSKNSKRGPKEWPFDQITAAELLERIANGMSLEAVCRQPDMPGRWIVRRWRHENPEFNEMLALARDDRKWCFLDQIVQIAESLTTAAEVRVAKVKIAALLWQAQVRDRGTFGKIKKQSYSIIVNTGISRGAGPYFPDYSQTNKPKNK